jgi:hypothetical protein
MKQSISLLTILIIVCIAMIIILIGYGNYEQKKFEIYKQEHHCVKKTDIEQIITVYACDGGETIIR